MTGRLVGVIVCTALAAGHAPEDGVTFSERQQKRILQHSPLGPAPPDPTNRVADDPGAATLGRRLFFDTRLSANGAVSCATCHDPARGFSDGRSLAEGLMTGERHSMSLWNVAYNRWFFWDGRADTIWAQALSPIERDLEMDGNRLQAAHLVAGDPVLRREYESVFGPLPPLDDGDRFPPAGRPVPDDPLHPHQHVWASMKVSDRIAVDTVFANLGKAIGAYERRIVSRSAPFDTFVEGLRSGDPGKLSALSPSAQRGLALFIGKANCRLCHTGPNFSDGEFHDVLVPPLDGLDPRDPGRYQGVGRLQESQFNATGAHSDDPAAPAAKRTAAVANPPDNWGRFKTPTLRNVARTAPYMHQGQYATLREVIRHYSTLEDAVSAGHHREQILVPLDLDEGQIDDLVAFLESLTDESAAADLGSLEPGSPPERKERQVR